MKKITTGTKNTALVMHVASLRDEMTRNSDTVLVYDTLDKLSSDAASLRQASTERKSFPVASSCVMTRLSVIFIRSRLRRTDVHQRTNQRLLSSGMRWSHRLTDAVCSDMKK